MEVGGQCGRWVRVGWVLLFRFFLVCFAFSGEHWAVIYLHVLVYMPACWAVRGLTPLTREGQKLYPFDYV
jgi:hypothetical protein